jgi:hypothetical protein
MKTTRKVFLASVHYLRSPIASLQTLISALSLPDLSPKKSEILLKLQKSKAEELDFRVELFLNYLLKDFQLKKLSLEFLDLQKLLQENKELKALEIPKGANIELLSDKDILLVLLKYFIRLATALDPKAQPQIRLSEKLQIDFTAKVSKQELQTDLELEKEILKDVLANFSKWLHGSFEEEIKQGRVVYRLILPRKFNP